MRRVFQLHQAPCPSQDQTLVAAAWVGQGTPPLWKGKVLTSLVLCDASHGVCGKTKFCPEKNSPPQRRLVQTQLDFVNSCGWIYLPVMFLLQCFLSGKGTPQSKGVKFKNLLQFAGPPSGSLQRTSLDGRS